MKTNIRIVVVLIILSVIISPPKAQAYLDPGTGSYVLQIVVGVLFGGIFVIKTFWSKISNFIKRIFSGKDKKESEKSPKENK